MDQVSHQGLQGPLVLYHFTTEEQVQESLEGIELVFGQFDRHCSCIQDDTQEGQ